ncbi:MAG: PTS galactosamine/N-acetylgalactosamine transporter subunit IIA [Selenomonadaceae bacterium]
MISVIITGHGEFATGLLSALQLVAGEQSRVTAVNFPEGAGSEDLQRALSEAAAQLGDSEIVFLADIAGGSPYNQAVMLSKKLKQECRVFSGTNMPLLLSVIFDREGLLADLCLRWLGAGVQPAIFREKKKIDKSMQAGGI